MDLTVPNKEDPLPKAGRQEEYSDLEARRGVKPNWGADRRTGEPDGAATRRQPAASEGPGEESLLPECQRPGHWNCRRRGKELWIAMRRKKRERKAEEQEEERDQRGGEEEEEEEEEEEPAPKKAGSEKGKERVE
ncbi:hypothetical protein EV368DRAFT_86972 [Lentinula lateritia]|nr:hypothetical protein EV368DRAFT_86972 [Lentinula lateritia]